MSVYRVILWLYPASFRAEYGDEMSAIFARRWRQSPAAARRLLLWLEALVDACRNAPPLHADILRQDLTSAWRTIRRAPGLSATVVIVAALGIGATTAAFSLADHVLVKPLPFQDPERLVKIWLAPPGGGRLEASPGHYRDWKAASSFERLGAFSATSANLVGSGEPIRLDGSLVSGELFSVLGAVPLVGRVIVPEDDRETAALTVVISERLWRARFGGDRRVIGTIATLNDAPRAIVGVMPRSFEFPTRTVDFWIPFQFRPEAYTYQNPYLQLVARLQPGVAREQSLAEMQQHLRDLARTNSSVSPRIGVSVIGLRDEIAPRSRVLLWCLVAAAIGVLLIACTNLANLLLTRGLARQKELAVRAALGAGRHRLTRQMLTESLLLGTAGGIAGVALAVVALPTVVRLVPSGLPISEVPSLDMRLLAAAVAVTLANAAGFGLIPALRTARQADAGALREGARAGTGRRTERLRSTLVIAQVATSIVLLVSSGLLLRAMLNVRRTETGFIGDGVLTLRTALPLPKYATVARRHAFFDRVLDDMQALPGVAHAAYVTGLPLVMRGMIFTVTVPGQEILPPEQRTVGLRFVTPGFFSALGIPLRAGRDVAAGDAQSAPFVAVVSASFAKRHWPGEDPIGKRFTIAARERIVAGVVGDVRVRGLESPSEPQVYLPSRQVADGALMGYIPKDLVVKSRLPPATLVPAIRAIVARADPEQPISDVQLLASIVDGETAPRRVQVRVLGAFAAVAFLLAGIGLHGLLAHSVSQRAREIGVRIALGAERLTILRMVVARGLVLAVVGVLLGALLALAAGRSLQAVLAGISPADAGTFAVAIALALVVTFAGSLLPALRAIRVDPITVMRDE